MLSKLWGAVGIAMAAGFAVGLIAGARLLPAAEPGNSDLVDLSALSDELREKHRDQAFLRTEDKSYAMGKEIMARRAAERAKRQRVELPEGMETVPLGQLYEPGETIHWPDGIDGELGDVLAAAKDDWVILNYWASWCAPCVHELPEMGEAAPVYAGKGIRLIAVNTDPVGQDTPASARQLFARKGVEHLVPYTAEGAALEALISASGQSRSDFYLPTSIIFAPGGVPYAIFEGGNLEEENVWTAPATLRFLERMISDR